MKSLRKWMLACVMLAIVITAVMLVPQVLQPGDTAVAELDTAQLHKGRIDRIERLMGRVADLNSRKLSFAATGVVSGIEVEEGERVRAGALLARMEAEPEYAEKLAAARLDLEAAQQRVGHAREEALQARELHEAGIESQQTLRKKESAWEDEQQKRRRAEAALRAMKDRAGQYALRADADAQVMAIDLVRGQRAAANQGVTLGDPRNLVIEARIDEATAAQLKAGQEMTYELSVDGERKIAGKSRIARISPIFDRDAEVRTPGGRGESVKIRAALMPEHLSLVRANQQVQLELRTGFREDALLAPAQAVVADHGQTHLLVLSDNRVRWIAVETGIEQRDIVEIRGGQASAGMRVVLPAGAPPADGQLAKIKEGAS